MRILKGLAASLLWILAGVLGLVSLLLCLTVILLPLGIPLLMLSRRLLGAAVRLMVPKEVAHPVRETKKGLRSRRQKAVSAADDVASRGRKAGRKAGQTAAKQSRKAAGAVAEKATGRSRRKRRLRVFG
jgi:hypothetical protein